ncbi:hypothetical protein BGX23_002843 [Mortierella sp. AD031]|nr:hypothetical protein BGX23_002843 [Mortierella sp. AD031]
MIEELETKITTVEAEALEFKDKAELEYEQLSDGFKVLKTRRSEEIKVLKAELEQHKLQEQIIEKLQADIDQLQSALTLVASSQSTENARINQVTAELNEALALKDQEVVQVRQNMTEFEESHNRLVSSLQATLATINEEADSARKSRDEAVNALESLREELEALRHSLPINNKHMSLSQWSAEQQQLQQDQLKAIQELEEKLDGQVEGVKEDQQRAGILEANTKRKSQQLTLDLEHHLQLSNALVQQSNGVEQAKEDPSMVARVPEVPTKAAAATVESAQEKASLSKDLESSTETGTVSVRTMLKFLSQLQGRSSDFKENTIHHSREDTQMTMTGDNDLDYENQLRVYLTQLNDATLIEPWAKEKELEYEIQQLEDKIQTLLQKQTVAQASFEAQLQEERDQRDHLELLERQEREEIEQKVAEERRIRDEQILEQQHSIQSKEQELTLKESTLRKMELTLKSKEQELIAKEEAERLKRADSFPATPPFSAPITPFGSPSNADLFPSLLAAHGLQKGDESENDDDDKEAEEEARRVKEEAAREREQQAEMTAQQAKLIRSLEEKISQLEKRAEEHQHAQMSSFPSPPMPVTPRMSSSLRSSLLSSPPDTPPPTIALPPIPTDQGDNPRSSPAISEEGASHHPHHRKKSMSVAHSHSSESLANKAAAAAATEASVAAVVSKYQEEQRAMSEKLAKFEAELTKTQTRNKQLETNLVLVQKQHQEQQQVQAQSQSSEVEVRKLRQENTELAQVLEEIRQSLDQAQNQARGLEALKTQLEAQVQKERQAKDEANRIRDHLQTQLEEEKQKKKGGFLCF